jgi:hypothetical protein
MLRDELIKHILFYYMINICSTWLWILSFGLAIFYYTLEFIVNDGIYEVLYAAAG